MTEATTRDELKEKFTPDPELSLRSREMLKQLHTLIGHKFFVWFGMNNTPYSYILISVDPKGIFTYKNNGRIPDMNGSDTTFTAHVDSVITIGVKDSKPTTD